jgi:hypothetical protein
MSVAAGFAGRVQVQSRAMKAVFGFFDVPEFFAAGLVCKEWASLLSDDSQFWNGIMPFAS